MDSLFTLSPLALGAIPVVVGLVQVAKGLEVPSKYSPIISIAIAIVLLGLTGIVWQAFVIQGIIVGLAASGLYSGSKALMQG